MEKVLLIKSYFAGRRLDMKRVVKEITFICTDNIELQCCESIKQEAERRGYRTKVSNNKFEKCEIGFYLSHLNYPRNSKLSIIMLHDLGQQHGYWPDMWKNEFWENFDVGFLPTKEWADMWTNVSCYKYSRPRYGCFLSGWSKSDKIFQQDFSVECKKLVDTYGIDKNKKTVLYAPSWEWDGRQLEMVDIAQELDINLLIKQFPATPEVFPEQYEIITEAHKKTKGKKNIYILDPQINIFNAIQLCDVLVSEESSTLYEAMFMGKSVIAVTDWLVPDTVPPRLPEFPYDFVKRVSKCDLKVAICNILKDLNCGKEIIRYRDQNFPVLGNSSQIIMDVVDSIMVGKNPVEHKINELPLIKTPRHLSKSVKKRKIILLKFYIKKNIIEKSIVLNSLFSLYKKLRDHVR